MISVRNTPKPPKKKAPKPTIVVGLDDKLLCMQQRGGKLKAFNIKKRWHVRSMYLVVESREDLMFVKEEYKFHQDRMRKMELAHRAALRREAAEFFGVLEASRVYRPHRVKIKWEDA